MSVLRTFYPKALRNGNYRIVMESFESAEEIVRKSNEREITNDEFKEEFTRSQISKNSRWYGASSWKEATDLLKNGYADAVPELKKALDFTGKGESYKRATRNDVVGFAPVVPLALMGLPNSMITSYRQPVRNKVINVYLDRTALSFRSVQDITEAGKRFLSAIIDIEKQGYRINLTILKSNSDGTSGDMLSLKIKDANSPIDLQRISFPLIHTAFARCICFDWYSRCPLATYRYGFGRHLGDSFSNEEYTKAMEEIFREKLVLFEMEKLIDSSEEHIKDVILSANERLA